MSYPLWMTRDGWPQAPKRFYRYGRGSFVTRWLGSFLVKWKDLPVEDATWENEQALQFPGLKLLEDKQIWAGRTVMSRFS